MKIKILSAIILSGMLASMTACGGGAGAPSSSGNESAVQDTSSVQNSDTDSNAVESDNTAPAVSGAVNIQTSQDLMDFAARVNAGETTLNAVLANDIDMSDVCGASSSSFEPISNYEGIFDGQGNSIVNLYCVQTTGSAALFKSLDGAVKNLSLTDAVIESADGDAAGIAAGLHGSIESCSVSGSITGYKYAGGIVTDTYKDSIVSGCINEAAVGGGYFDDDDYCLRGAAAGIAAWPREGGTITDCINLGSITANGNMAAGIAGHCEAGMILIENCQNEGAIQGLTGVAELGTWGGNENYTGGIVGYAGENTVVTKCINDGSVSGTGFVGGVAAASGNFIINCANHGDIEATEEGQVYGITSLAVNGLLNCYNTGNIKCEKYACGIGSSSNAVLVNLYNYGSISCTSSDGVVTDAFPWSSGGAYTGLLNTYSKENCITVPSDFEDEMYIQAGNAAGDSAFTDGTILNALNEAADDINGSLTKGYGGLEGYIEEIKENENFELSGWKAGADSLPCFDWE